MCSAALHHQHRRGRQGGAVRGPGGGARITASAASAQSLLKYVVEQARAEGVLRITLLTDMQNERAQAMYRRVGFVGSPMKPMRLKIKKGTLMKPLWMVMAVLRWPPRRLRRNPTTRR